MQIVKGKKNRLYVPNAYEWSRSFGTDYMAAFGPESFDATAANHNNIAETGWTTTSLTQTAGSGADFLTSADVGISPHILMDTGNDLVQSPTIFGSYHHGLMAKQVLGYAPTRLVMECYAAFTTASNNETTCGFGFVEAGGSPIVANDAMAMITSNGTNFLARSGADSDAGAAIDTNWHLWKLILTTGTTDAVEWFIDGTSQGTFDLQEDLFPVSWGAGTATSNDLAVAWVHIYYL